MEELVRASTFDASGKVIYVEAHLQAATLQAVAQQVEGTSDEQLARTAGAVVEVLDGVVSGTSAYGDRFIVCRTVGHQSAGHFHPVGDRESYHQVADVSVGVLHAFVVIAESSHLDAGTHVKHETLFLDRAVGGRVERIDVVFPRAGLHHAPHAGHHRQVVRLFADADTELRVGHVETVLCKRISHQSNESQEPYYESFFHLS